MKIRTRFVLSTMACLGATVAIGAILFFTSRQVNGTLDQHRDAEEIFKGVFELNLLTSDYLLHHEERARRQWRSRHESLTRVLSSQRFKRPREQDILRGALEEHQGMEDLFSRLVTAYEEPGSNRQGTAASVELEERLASQLRVKSQAMVSRGFQLTETNVLEIRAAQDRAILLVIPLIVTMAVVLGVTGILMGSSVLKPVRDLQKGTEIVGTGNLDYKVGTSRRDEIGQLSRAFDRMTQKLRGITVSRDDLAEEVTERKRAEDALRERTADLAAANHELEAFSYSVSHDLRAPLRGMDGFSQAVLEEYADKLDATGKDYLQRVRAAAQRMGQLIDDLLMLSRVTRRETQRETVYLSALAQSIAAELQRTEPERQVEFTIQEGAITEGDSHLLRVVLDNLLNNAWKFTSEQPRARIEFGAVRNAECGMRNADLDEADMVYFVRDDGVGFDMTYVDKLFGAFQRLHSTSEFPGTGIGLATVERIIHRHGGRVWAEGEVENGATFYFTLP